MLLVKSLYFIKEMGGSRHASRNFVREKNSVCLVFSCISLCGFICIASLLLPSFFCLDISGRETWNRGSEFSEIYRKCSQEESFV